MSLQASGLGRQRIDFALVVLVRGAGAFQAALALLRIVNLEALLALPALRTVIGHLRRAARCQGTQAGEGAESEE